MSISPSSLSLFRYRSRSTTAHLIRSVFDDDVGLVVLEIPQRQEHDITLVDPDLFPHLATDMGESFGPVETLGFYSTVPEHLEDLGVFCQEVARTGVGVAIGSGQVRSVLILDRGARSGATSRGTTDLDRPP